ncbi:MAG: hypothetical protein R3D67_02205 [Hyphomicrobiaceae bacterium]
MAHLDIRAIPCNATVDQTLRAHRCDGFLSPESVKAVNRTFPAIEKGGSYHDSLEENMTIREVIEELDGS